ncbi:metallophosphoesterase family protein [Mucilaginibacter agri]|uniref:Calcineurin-like phosphoesterase domain-containing protein n=1 Tax=Mucilaginibacter agri TaxID=2695265 RepID=A0A965ZCN6_9SPHI|nr:metallophosphoesterase [Mucilaginibacter agri]NCD68568.1 hypothetical protein [Mucilaginibacter agri]
MGLNLKSIVNFVRDSHQKAADNLLSWDIFQSDWAFLQQSEQKLVGVITGNEVPDHQPGDEEYGLILYLLNYQMPPPLQPVKDLLKQFGMPDSIITPEQYQIWLPNLETGFVTSDGTLINTTKYATLDPDYLIAALHYLRTKSHIPLFSTKTHPYGTTPAVFDVPDTDPLTIAVFGDWGTGKWQDSTAAMCPAELVNAGITSLNPDIVIHLGDVYYWGSSDQETANFSGMLVAGSKASFTLNSNHEMYDGGNGYFDVALTNPALSAQQQTSWFAITYSDWLLLGLDSAYFDDSTLFKSGTVTGDDQLAFIKEVVTKPENAGKKIIVMTHHNTINYDGASLNVRKHGGSLAQDVFEVLGNRMPEFWYYGHLHNGIVYNAAAVQQSNVFAQFGNPAIGLRCMGHAGIPAGEARGLVGNPIADYFVTTPMGGNDPRHAKRVLNGFALFTLETGKITEAVYEVANSNTGAKCTVAWQQSTTF